MTAANHNPAASAEGFDELDPHGFDKGHGHDHGHVIVGPFTLRSVLGALLFFTVLTVFLAQAEVWAQSYFHIELPWWVNVVGAMSIAVVKALLVMGFFMQLKYDNPINTVLMCFCFAALMIFLGFTGMDLLNRDKVEPYKAVQVTPGGTGMMVEGSDNKPMVTAAHDRLMERLKKQTGSEEAAKAKYAEMEETMHRAHGHVEEHEPDLSTARQSRPKTGLTDALSATAAPKNEHSEHAPAASGEAKPQAH
jgi:cytochrome c oxidase subunit 4